MTKTEAREYVRRIRAACRQADVAIAVADDDRLNEASGEIAGCAALLAEYAETVNPEIGVV